MGVADISETAYAKYTNINARDYFDNSTWSTTGSITGDNSTLNQIWPTDGISGCISTDQSIPRTLTWTKDKDYIDANTLNETIKMLEEKFSKGDNNMAELWHDGQFNNEEK